MGREVLMAPPSRSDHASISDWRPSFEPCPPLPGPCPGGFRPAHIISRQHEWAERFSWLHRPDRTTHLYPTGALHSSPAPPCLAPVQGDSARRISFPDSMNGQRGSHGSTVPIGPRIYIRLAPFIRALPPLAWPLSRGIPPGAYHFQTA